MSYIVRIKRLIYILLSGLLLLSNSAKAGPGKETHLGIGIFTAAHSTILTYAFITTRDDKLVGAQIVRKQMFMYVAMGHWPGIVNPKRENLFTKNEVDSCFLVKDEYDKIVGYYAPPFDSIWKIRYYEHPSNYDSFGWSHGRYKPSQKQMEYLHSEYGILNLMTEYIWGENLYRLLKDVRRVDWIANYHSLPKDPLVQDP